MMQTARLTTPVLIIGSGISGATAALTLADAGIEVTLITAEQAPGWCNTSLAQGGIVYKGVDDKPSDLEADMLTAGWKHNYRKAVRHIARSGPEAVREVLIERLNIPFKSGSDFGGFDMTREGGHSHKRILHCADFTGKAIMDGLMREVATAPNVRLLTRRTAIDLLTTHHHARHLDYKYALENQCAGAYVFNDETGQVETMLADMTVLATGGVGRIFLHSTNTRGTIGSGLAMAFRAGAKLMNSEYVQFHPTALFHRSDQRFLISEAVRGEGAKLTGADGKPFMQRYDARADLAPRDIVTRAIMEELLRTDEDCVYLDAASHVNKDLAERFPTIFEKCLSIGIDIRRDPIPVVPAAHYFCGGVLTDLAGHTSLQRLYAVGECACTGVHGANRLASTSLLEGVLWGRDAARDIARKLNRRSMISRKLQEAIPDWQSTGQQSQEDPALISQDWARIRHTMWNYVGISRTTARLKRAFDDMRALNKHMHDFYRETPISKPLIDLFHGCQAAYSITVAALRNRTTLGCHHRID